MIQISDRLSLDIIKETDKPLLLELANDQVLRMNLGDTMPYPHTERDADTWIEYSQ